ncbi:MAG TPA: biotin/lipoyl-binding protein [Clostridiaceae bacterium]|nr:biotin/lipoyl-binding protein [Clostridiaceae bacterium]
MKKFLIKVNGTQYEVEVEEIREQGSNIDIVSQARASMPSPAPAPKAVPEPAAAPKPAPAAPKAESASKSVPTGAKTITAPMPGTILDINVNVGDKVKKGQVLLILEAMKMENEIVAPFEGTVASINTSKGATVNAGDVLVSIS